MTPMSGMLAVFASNNKEVVQNPNSSSRVEAVFTRVEFAHIHPHLYTLLATGEECFLYLAFTKNFCVANTFSSVL